MRQYTFWRRAGLRFYVSKLPVRQYTGLKVGPLIYMLSKLPVRQYTDRYAAG